MSTTELFSEEEFIGFSENLLPKFSKRKNESRHKSAKKHKNDDDLFCPSQIYLGFEMFFLKNPIVYKFAECTMLTKTKFSYRVSKIHEADINDLNSVLRKLNSNMKVIGNEAYMNGTALSFKNNEFPDDNIEFNSALRWKIIAQIQGYKASASGRVSPIWKILKAHESI